MAKVIAGTVQVSAKLAAAVLELRAKGMGFPAIARELGLPARVSKGGRPDVGGRAYDIYHRNATKVVKFQGTRVAAAKVKAVPAAESKADRKKRLDREYQQRKRDARKAAK